MKRCISKFPTVKWHNSGEMLFPVIVSFFVHNLTLFCHAEFIFITFSI